MASVQRRKRLEGQIQREVAEILRLEFRDPRLGMVTVSGVEVSPDLEHARIFVTTLDDIDNAIGILRGASGFIRSALGKRIHIRKIPEINFLYDHSITDGIRMDRLIDEALGKNPSREIKE